MKKYPSQEIIKEYFEYNPEKGIFRWRKASGRVGKPGKIAGSKSRDYPVIGFNGETYEQARLAWLYVYGTISSDFFIKSKNKNNRDIRIANLYAISKNEVSIKMNKSKKKPSYISYHSASGKYRACIQRNGKKLEDRYFKTLKEAKKHAIYLRKKYGKGGQA